jgi:hypothetical protein
MSSLPGRSPVLALFVCARSTSLLKQALAAALNLTPER